MNAIHTVIRKIVGLFVDDGWLAIETLGVVALTAVVRLWLQTEPMLAGATLLLGCFGAFTRSVVSVPKK